MVLIVRTLNVESVDGILSVRQRVVGTAACGSWGPHALLVFFSESVREKRDGSFVRGFVPFVDAFIKFLHLFIFHVSKSPFCNVTRRNLPVGVLDFFQGEWHGGVSAYRIIYRGTFVVL